MSETNDVDDIVSHTKHAAASTLSTTNPQMQVMSQEAVKSAVALKELVVRGMVKKKAWDMVKSCRIAGETDERCRSALVHIRKVCNLMSDILWSFHLLRLTLPSTV